MNDTSVPIIGESVIEYDVILVRSDTGVFGIEFLKNHTVAI